MAVIRVAARRTNGEVITGIPYRCFQNPIIPEFPWMPPRAYITEPAKLIEDTWNEVWIVFGNRIRNNGVYNPRTVAGSSYYSEHAWGAAWDISTPIGSPSNVTIDTLTEVNRYLCANGARLGIKRTIWRDGQYREPSYRRAKYTGTFHAAHIHLETADHDGAKPPWVT